MGQVMTEQTQCHRFDDSCWPNATDLVDLVRSLGNGSKILHSTYPWVDNTSVNFKRFLDAGLLAIDAKSGAVANVSPAPGGAVIDPFIPGAKELVWDFVKKGYYDAGIEMFWLDDTEPNVHTRGIQWGCGIAEYCGALWPNRWVEIFTEGLKREGLASPVMLSRAGWAGFAATGAVLWSSDIPSTFESLQVQVRAGLSAAMSGFLWWTTDVGGFFGGNISSPQFRELIVRWYQYGALCPIFRTHGDRSAPQMSPLPNAGPRWGESGSRCDAPGGHVSGAQNEPWAFGADTYAMLAVMIKFRDSIKPYVAELARNATAGAPPMRPLFYDFPDDERVFSVDDEFMFGTGYLVAPILFEGARRRTVYFPSVFP